MRWFGATDEEIKQNAKAIHGWGENGYTLYERITIRPALSINGIVGGYQGPGVKSVIPAKATVKLNLRLVPDQDPFAIEQLLRQYLQEITPSTVSIHVHTNLHAKPYEMSIRHPAIRAGKWALMKGFGTPPILTRVGGTIPVVSLLEKLLGMSTILLGFGLPGDRIHAPNERFSLANFSKGIHTSIWFMTALSKDNLFSGRHFSASKVDESNVYIRNHESRKNGHSKYLKL
jgi:acetylornithine deacetylase/succinyl-diaminopimelate desuccinylase-like protein